jgi:hypothetical protein
VAEAKLDITDELLVAYVDDELDPAQREMVSSVLASSPALCRRADQMRLSRELLREAFPLRADSSVPAPVEAAANRLAEACSQRSSPTPVSTSPQVSIRSRGRWKYAAAAGLVLSVALSASYLTWRSGSNSTERPMTALTQISPDTPLYAVLESKPSAEVIDIPTEGASLRAVLTYRAKDERFCREFEILASAGGGSTGVPCREDGEWRTEVLMSAASAPPNGNSYTPAAGSEEQAVDDVVDRLIQGDPLSAGEEARVLASGWQAPESP